MGANSPGLPPPLSILSRVGEVYTWHGLPGLYGQPRGDSCSEHCCGDIGSGSIPRPMFGVVKPFFSWPWGSSTCFCIGWVPSPKRVVMYSTTSPTCAVCCSKASLSHACRSEAPSAFWIIGALRAVRPCWPSLSPPTSLAFPLG